MILTEPDVTVWKSFRNFPGVVIKPAIDVCAYDVVAGGLLIVEQAAMEALSKRVGLGHYDGRWTQMFGG